MSPIAQQLLRHLAQVRGIDSVATIFIPNELNRFPGNPIEVSTAWQELQACGLVVIAVSGISGVSHYGQHAYLTDRGRAWIRAGGATGPEDPDGFLTALSAADPDMEPFVKAVISEALWAHAHQRPVSALVCLCAAAERMVRAVDDKTSTPKQAQNISQVWESLEKRLANERKRPHVVTFLSTTFTAIRDARNDVAHKGTVADLLQVRRFILQYLDWHEAAAKLRDNPLC